jgi:hypothetical protein
MLKAYNKKGWVHLKEVVPDDVINELRTRAIKLREWVNDKVGTPSKYGSDIHWLGIGCAGMYDKYLMGFYKHDIMYEISSELLETKDVWLYNDQIVVKLPNDEFDFKAHSDNEAEGTNSVNLCVILDDFTDENGTLEMYNKHNNEIEKVYPKAGDIVAIHGDTLHKSQPNISDNPRCLYACVYAANRLNHMNFYKTKFKQDLL